MVRVYLEGARKSALLVALQIYLILELLAWKIERNYSTPVTIKVNKQITQNTATVGGRRREKDFGLFLTTVIGRPAKKARRPAKNSLFLCSVASGFLPISRRLDCTRNGRLRGT